MRLGAEQSRQSLKTDWAPIAAVASILILGIAFGAGGMRYAMGNLVVQLTAFAVLAIRRDAVFDFWRGAPVSLRILIALSLLLPVVQIVPLPPSIWMGLPGRDLVAQSFELTGRTGWAPVSVDPVRTFLAFTALVTPIAVLASGWTLTTRQLLWIGWILAGLGLVIVLIGIPQVLSGGNSAVFYERVRGNGILYGTFANRNSTGVFLVAALLLALLLPAPIRHPAASWLRLGLCILLGVGIVLTQSRTALALTAIPLALAALRAFTWSRTASKRDTAKPSRMPLLMFAAFALGITAVGATLTLAPGRVADTVERFEARDDPRRYIWEDAAYSVSRYWPVGSGMGTFDEVFQVDESLENATMRRAGRAHNDFLEVAVEAGLIGLALIVFWLVMVAALAWRARHSELRWTAWAAASVLLVIALQSITDYPLRNQAMLASASIALLLLARIAHAKAGREA